MKTRNALVFIFSVLLLVQIPIREFVREPYPMIVLPAGAGVYEHNTDTITTSRKIATVYGRQKDSTRVPLSVLFPESPSQYHTYMYFSLAQANSNSENSEWKRASQWIRKNVKDSVSLSKIDSLCIHSIRESIPTERGSTELTYTSSTCHRLIQ